MNDRDEPLEALLRERRLPGLGDDAKHRLLADLASASGGMRQSRPTHFTAGHGKGSVMREGRQDVGSSSPVMVGGVIVAAGLSLILLVAWYSLAGRVRAVERRPVPSSRDTKALDRLSAGIDRLSDRLKALEDARPTADIDGRLAHLADRIASLKRSDDERRGLARSVNELKGLVASLGRETAMIKGLAEGAAKPRRAPVAAPTGGTDSEAVDRLSARARDIETRVEELAKALAEAAGKAGQKINEKALREFVSKEVSDALAEQLKAAIRDVFKDRRTGGGRR